MLHKDPARAVCPRVQFALSRKAADAAPAIRGLAQIVAFDLGKTLCTADALACVRVGIGLEENAVAAEGGRVACCGGEGGEQSNGQGCEFLRAELVRECLNTLVTT